MFAMGLPVIALPLPVNGPGRAAENDAIREAMPTPAEGAIDAINGEPADIPEEVARTEIILEARSPIDGTPLTAAEYAELLAEIEARDYPPELSSDLQQLIFLLRLRKLVRTFTPF